MLGVRLIAKRRQHVLHRVLTMLRSQRAGRQKARRRIVAIDLLHQRLDRGRIVATLHALGTGHRHQTLGDQLHLALGGQHVEPDFSVGALPQGIGLFVAEVHGQNLLESGQCFLVTTAAKQLNTLIKGVRSVVVRKCEGGHGHQNQACGETQGAENRHGEVSSCTRDARGGM